MVNIYNMPTIKFMSAIPGKCYNHIKGDRENKIIEYLGKCIDRGKAGDSIGYGGGDAWVAVYEKDGKQNKVQLNAFEDIEEVECPPQEGGKRKRKRTKKRKSLKKKRKQTKKRKSLKKKRKTRRK